MHSKPKERRSNHKAHEVFAQLNSLININNVEPAQRAALEAFARRVWALIAVAAWHSRRKYKY